MCRREGELPSRYARSCLPSPLKSLTARARGSEPVRIRGGLCNLSAPAVAASEKIASKARQTSSRGPFVSKRIDSTPGLSCSTRAQPAVKAIAGAKEDSKFIDYKAE